MSQPYFVDGPTMIKAAKDHVYVIQPPGYWLYTRLAGLFPDPALGLSLMNALMSSLGAFVFYLACLHLTTRLAARLATAVYASVYFAWFAGSTHSSYAGELLFAPLIFLFMLRYMERPRSSYSIGVAASYAVAAGIRPSDGVFLAPLFVFFVLRYIGTWRDRILTIGVAGVLCLGWYVPQQLALSKLGKTSQGQLWSVAHEHAPLLVGFSKLALSNVIRVVFPLLVGFGCLLPGVTADGDRRIRRLLWIWIIPGLAFFTLIYMSDATYLCFLISAIILLFLRSRPNRRTHAALALCAIWNILFFSLARPVEQTRSISAAIYSVSGARYCAWALRHQWYRTLDTYTDVPLIKRETKISARHAYESPMLSRRVQLPRLR